MVKRSFALLFVFALLLALSPNPGTAQSGIVVGGSVEVVTEGVHLNLRSEPSLEAAIIAKLPEGTILKVIGGPQSAEGYTWWQLTGELGTGWAVETYLQASAAEPEAQTAVQQQPRCESRQAIYPGIDYCLRDGGLTHVLLIDLDDPHVRFETVLAGNAEWTYAMDDAIKETIPAMAARVPETAAAINSDYTGAGHGPEGLTIRNGIRLDGIERNDTDNAAVLRSSLVISKPLLDGGTTPIRASILKLPDDRYPLDGEAFYTAAGGGPQIIKDSAWQWVRGGASPCPGSVAPADVINGECFSNSSYWDGAEVLWTSMGVTGDNQMVWVIAQNQHTQAALEAFNTQQAIKMDGGGSSQLWAAGDILFQSTDNPDRRLASGLLVFYWDSAKVAEKPLYPILVEKENLKINLTLENTGSNSWIAGEYRLVFKDPGGEEHAFALPNDVPPGRTASWSWETEPFEKWGLYTGRGTMYKGDEPFLDDEFTLKVVVIPEKLRDKKEELEQQVKEWAADELENIEALILQWIKERASSILGCNLPAALLAAVLGIGRLFWRRAR